ncbi:hypothetical protein [Haloimpatiens massiliensis]|uniref:hypothetical protein n=1 Tax=Haloimpatiens massiliensis TaxID=1658110 RepID=UPI000C814ABE|nr:hypothetical protein [Haloimpatiens massiliensis]
MRIEKILKVQQPREHKQLNENRKENKKKSRRGENLSFSDVMELMKHDSYKRGKGGALRQR